ncbi:hypothetical protein L1889_02165 [Paenalcaligenes niemegkensis]|uniref:hypothetical protein n=1 Tax=Paenalcaligenes niemegkensis TaxID=2895469 RepID=UPI001EE7B428|nr:hypothetical protein [Paenalcaligenes niemegkensis]MCQ9615664.1 hypothetical protein [Paenalcaligenes niemegkensis]
MSQDSPDIKEKLRELIVHLSDASLDAAEINAIVDIALEAQAHPEAVVKRLYGSDAARMAERHPTDVVAFILGVELEDHLIVADTVDELWEETIDCFETPQLAEFPYDDMPFSDVEGFYEWANTELLAHHANYALIEFSQHYNHEFQLALVKRENLDAVLNLCLSLDIHAQVCA